MPSTQEALSKYQLLLEESVAKEEEGNEGNRRKPQINFA